MAANPTVDESRWLALCASKGQLSPDPRTKVGCVIVGPDRRVRCEACNTYPTGVLDDIPERTEAPLKYIWIEHAERNAIYTAARRGISTEGCTVIVELTPCVECARAIIQAGVVQVVINHDRSAEYRGKRYSGEHRMALAMLAEAGIAIRLVSPKLAVRGRQGASIEGEE
ncbi:MAG TPA: deaminase [Bryobacteraceae bacterium]|nr:deaminase [Bryobacteraceae bacterium]